MKTETQTALIESATAAITAAALESITAILQAKAVLTIVIREQVNLLEKAGISQKEIATIVKSSVGTAASASHISRTLTACGVRLRGKRTDAGFLRMADGALSAAMEAKPAADGDDDGDDGGDGGDDGDDGGDDDGDDVPLKSGGHTAETLAALLGSIDPAIVAAALEIAGLA
jgi:hypothetical protein